MLTLYACNSYDEFAHGILRDIRVRWALEEAGLAYETRFVSREDRATGQYRAIHPFGKIPALVDDDGLVLFESAAILLCLGERSEALLPQSKKKRARVTGWVCAAATTVEWPVSTLFRIDHFPVNRDADQRIRPHAEELVQHRLAALSRALGDKPYLENRFSAADIMMRSVLDMLRHTGLAALYPNLKAYVIRCAERPAFARAMRDHLAAFESGSD